MLKRLKVTLIYGLLTVGALLMLIPFIWMIMTSLQPATVSLTMPTLKLPWPLRWGNYLQAWHAAPFARYCLNSVIVTVISTSGQLLTSILAAFAFTYLRFYGRRFLLGLLITTMMIPGELLLIPNFMTLARLHWIDTYAALIVPWLASTFAMFAFYQAFKMQPKTTYYAAKIDGATDWQFLWQLLVPANRETLITVGVLQTIGSWNAFMWPLIMTNSDRLRTLPVGLMAFTNEAGTNYPLLMASTLFVVLPLLILYVCLQKYIIAGITKTSLKG